MKYTADVRCLGCGHDEFDTQPDADALECMTRVNIACRRCSKVYRLSLTMVAIRPERLVNH
jgi:hypothetical protein